MSEKLLATLLFVAVLVMVFIFRHPIASKSIEHLAKKQNLLVSCLDFSFDWRLNLKIKRACISSPMGNIELREAIWQPWSDVLHIKQVKVKHLRQLAGDNEVGLAPAEMGVAPAKDLQSKELPTNKLNLADYLPQLSISSLNIDSYQLLQPLHLVVKQLSSDTLSISGDLNVSVNMQPNAIIVNIQWSLSDLSKYIPQAQNLFNDNAELLTDLARDESNIETQLTFDGKGLNLDSQLNINSRFYVSNCPIGISIKGNILVNVDISNLHTRLDFSQLSNDFSLKNCPLLADYFVADDWPQLSFILPQEIMIDATQISLPELQIVDKRNPHRSIVLSALTYQTTGELSINYKVSLKQPIKAKQVAARMVDFNAEGNVNADLSILNTPQPISLKFTDNNNRLVVSNLQAGSLSIGKLTSDISLSGTSVDDLKLSIDNQFSQLLHPDFNLQSVTNHLELNILKLATIGFSGHSTVTNLSAQNIHLLPIDVAHTGLINLPNMTVTGQHKINLEQGFIIDLSHQKTQAKLQITEQDITGLQSIISQLESTLVVNEGNLSANIEFTLQLEGEQFAAQGKLDLQRLSAKYQDHVLSNITYQTPLVFDSAGLQLVESTLRIDSIDAGVMIENIEANIIAKDSVLGLKQVQGEIFNGQFSF
ncbi:MAG: hypothetical protein JKY14_06650, partial [Paraglaciecola sp.]|nr:hypothetical protein [Paraglaciecola sp.]